MPKMKETPPFTQRTLAHGAGMTPEEVAKEEARLRKLRVDEILRRRFKGPTEEERDATVKGVLQQVALDNDDAAIDILKLALQVRRKRKRAWQRKMDRRQSNEPMWDDTEGLVAKKEIEASINGCGGNIAKGVKKWQTRSNAPWAAMDEDDLVRQVKRFIEQREIIIESKK
jgi:ParB-like chromosome segregation protein Spo0J